MEVLQGLMVSDNFDIAFDRHSKVNLQESLVLKHRIRNRRSERLAGGFCKARPPTIGLSLVERSATVAAINIDESSWGLISLNARQFSPADSLSARKFCA